MAASCAILLKRGFPPSGPTLQAQRDDIIRLVRVFFFVFSVSPLRTVHPSRLSTRCEIPACISVPNANVSSGRTTTSASGPTQSRNG